jgi:hypothetical protein
MAGGAAPAASPCRPTTRISATAKSCASLRHEAVHSWVWQHAWTPTGPSNMKQGRRISAGVRVIAEVTGVGIAGRFLSRNNTLTTVSRTRRASRHAVSRTRRASRLLSPEHDAHRAMQRFSRQSLVVWKFSRYQSHSPTGHSPTRRPRNGSCITVRLELQANFQYDKMNPSFNGTALHFPVNRFFDCAVLDCAPRDPVERLPVDADAAVGALAYTPDEVETRDLRHRRPRP